MNRRDFFGRGLAAVLVPAALDLRPALDTLAGAAQTAAQRAAQGPQLPGAGAEGSLRDPAAAGRSQEATSRFDNDPTVKGIELRLACRCGCTLDVFTCRTTDFTCTYSPAMHREVVALHEQGQSPPQIVDAFVAKYGETVLMAPKPRGFNLAGYLVPGAAITAVGGALAWVLVRRHRLAPAAAGGADGADGAAGAASGPAPYAMADATLPHAPASPEELARLERALQELED
ncbi:MAG TPA: cytochrome c-type biogenesis protein CcmH [Gemmatimonadales bacterium]|nr:cytochrome c-type biogenesis protein CcmH [Gemmatimonadales bacterium]